MKKSILAIVLTVAMLATCMLPAFAEAPEGMFEIAVWEVDIVEDGTIKVDGKCEDAYYNSSKITHYDDAEPYKRGGYDAVHALADARFFAYIVVDSVGMYVYAEVEDTTLFETTNSNGNDGDCLQLYFDWVPYAEMHPQVANYVPTSEASWGGQSYKSANGYDQRIGWISCDYNGAITGSAGFANPDYLGYNFDGFQYEASVREDKTGWVSEWFIPWFSEAQIEAVKNGEQFHCSIGFQACDDSDFDDSITAGTEENVGLRFDQDKSYGLSYWAYYSFLSDLHWGTRPAATPETSDAVIAVVAALAIAGAGVVIFSKKREN